jgi:SAM-dependent methyltransferase
MELHNILKNLPDKTEYKNTTSHKFKADLLEFFKDKELGICLEIGTNHGHTTHVLSHLFNHVYTIDLHESNINIAKSINRDRKNITYITGDAYDAENYKNVPLLDVAFIDCVHHYSFVMQDIQRVVDKSNNLGVYLIFDDYGHPNLTEVYDAVQDAVQQGLQLETYIGEKAGFTFKQLTDPTTLLREEGVILSYGK